MADAAAVGRIALLLTELKLPTIKKVYAKLAKEVAHAGGDFMAFLDTILQEEVSERRRRRIERRIKEARFRQIKLLSELDAQALPNGITVDRLQQLATGDYLRERANILAVGSNGTGKTHVCVGLGIEACRQDKRVRFFTATELASELEAAQEEHQLHRYLRRFAAYDLVLVDELGYVPISHGGAELLFQAFSERHERGSMIVNTNLAFAEWAQVFKTERLAVALLDRLTHRAHILEMNGESYRLRSALKQRKKTKGGDPQAS
jgi:DNA replication protein DnaC